MSGSIARPSARARVDHAMIHYRHGLAAGEMAKRSHEAPWRYRDAQPKPKETTMFRTFATAAILALTVTAAQAGTTDQLGARIHDAAVTACAPERVSGALPRSHYGAIDDQCVYRISQSAMTKYQAQAKATAAARAQLAGK